VFDSTFGRRGGPSGPPARAGLKTRAYVGLLLVASFVLLRAQTPPFDLVVLNGRVIDGTGAAARVTDIGIRDGRVAALGSLAAAPSAGTIDASGLVVAPGFIDVHTHADDIAAHPLAENFAQMGVTTIVAGKSGSSALDNGPELR
jgi:N-acyl-D-amino-acid deacylase